MLNRGKPPIKLEASRFDWATFDALPPVVQRALNEAAFKYVIKPKLLPSVLAEPNAWAARIRSEDAKQIAASYRQREAVQDLADLGLFV